MRNRVVYGVLLIIGIYLVVSLSRSILLFWSKQDVLKKAEQKVALDMKKNQELSEQLAQVRSQEFVEEQARNKLNLARPNETVVVVPKDLVGQIATYSGQIKGENKPGIPNWKQWWNLFF